MFVGNDLKCSWGRGRLQNTSSDVKASRTCWPQGHNSGLSLERLSSAYHRTFYFWPREKECNDGTGSHCEFVMIIYQSYLLTNLVFFDIHLFKFVVIFNYLGVDEVLYIMLYNCLLFVSMDSENCPRPQRFVQLVTS